MKDKRLSVVFVFVALLCMAAVGTSTEAENQQMTNTIDAELIPQSVPVIYPMRQEFVDSFERANISPWTTGGDALSGFWAIRDTLDTYGPQAPAWDGYQYPGHPSIDTSAYPSPGANPGYLTWIASPTVDITGWTALYVSFSYWSDLEGAATNFDGAIVEISPDNGVTWLQVDSNATGHLNPTYDAQLANTGQLLTKWAYCYTTNPNWVKVSSQDLMALGYVSAGNQVQVRINFAYDALAGGQGFFVDDFRIADTPPPDLQPPVFVHTPLPDTADTISNYTVSAVITDVGSGVNPDSVMLHYEIENGPVVDVNMTLVSPDTYEADIPAQTWHTDIYYRIMAADSVGNWGQTQLYNFEVTNARTIIYDDNQPNFGPIVVNAGDGSFTRFVFSDVGIDSGLVHQLKVLLDNVGEVDIRLYEAISVGQPGPFIDSVAGYMSPGYQWSTIDLTDLNIATANPLGIFVGYIMIDDSVGVARDSIVNHPAQMWNYISSAWTAEASGDFLMRLKVIPLDEPGIDEYTNKPFSAFSLAQIAPNPVKTTGLIEYQLPTHQRVSLKVYDVAGKLVKTLVSETADAGTYQVVWDGRDERGSQVASGVYLYRLQGENENATKKLIFVR
jgi:hypothetical protein